MVSLVIVSHCHQLAHGVKELADQMANGQIAIAAVGGIVIGNKPPALGTDAVRICEAIESIWAPDGVLLLVDLGSAILSTNLALDMLSKEMRDTCLISNAPLVEGAVIAALEASINHGLNAVNEAAEAASQYTKVTR